VAKSLQTEFVKYYKEKLEPFGFQKVKGRQPYFVRVINDEIIHVITYMGGKSIKPGYKEMNLMCGVATVYKKEINFSVSPTQNSDWLIPLGTICELKDTAYPIVKIPRDFKEYYYNDDNILSVINDTYEGVKILIDELDKVSEMDKVLWHILKHIPKDITFKHPFDDGCFDEEGLYFSRSEYDEENIIEFFNNRRLELKNSGRDVVKKEEGMRRIQAWEEKLKKARNSFLSSDVEYEQGMLLLRERYNQNVNKLIEYGLNIHKKDIIF